MDKRGRLRGFFVSITINVVLVATGLYGLTEPLVLDDSVVFILPAAQTVTEFAGYSALSYSPANENLEGILTQFSTNDSILLEFDQQLEQYRKMAADGTMKRFEKLGMGLARILTDASSFLLPKVASSPNLTQPITESSGDTTRSTPVKKQLRQKSGTKNDHKG
ncbi:hypothetical protein KFU94_11160 [Chloroflexi bacterium TSY]|nr:hypothetical protein [Chloroflexi bacterium TSY]